MRTIESMTKDEMKEALCCNVGGRSVDEKEYCEFLADFDEHPERYAYGMLGDLFQVKEFQEHVPKKWIVFQYNQVNSIHGLFHQRELDFCIYSFWKCIICSYMRETKDNFILSIEDTVEFTDACSYSENLDTDILLEKIRGLSSEQWIGLFYLVSLSRYIDNIDMIVKRIAIAGK